MARPRSNSPPDQFTSGELAIGAGLSARSIGLLQERGLAPPAFSGPAGKAGARLHDVAAFKQGALIGAAVKAGVELFPAARLAAAVADDLGAAHGEIRSNLESYLRRKDFAPMPSPEDAPLGGLITEDFWLHHILRSRTGIYEVRTALRDDLLLEIADREFVFFLWELRVSSPFGSEADHASPEYRITGWERGGEGVQVSRIFDEIPRGWAEGDQAAIAKGQAIEAEFHRARRNAVGLLRINISLAIRNAFDALHDHRMATGASFDWSASARPIPAGVDEQGWPLDPAHHWNREG